MSELVVISANGPHQYERCVESWQCRASNLLLLDTGSGEVRGASANVGPVWQTGAFLYAYREVCAEAYLFTQDTVTVLPEADPLPWFRRRMPPGGLGAVGWQLFAMDDWRVYAENRYADVIARRDGSWTPPEYGIVGPVFYTTRRTLELLDELDLLPDTPSTREEASGSERTWAYAFELAGVPLVGDLFAPHEIPARVTEHYPLRKVWMH